MTENCGTTRTLSERERLDLEVKVSEVFRPAAPIDRAALFAGRHDEIRTVLDVVHQTGQHAVIYGERGVGKTSLANVLFDVLSTSAGQRQYIAPKVHCDSTDDFSAIWRKLLQEIEIQLSVRQLGFLPGTEIHKFSLSETMDAKTDIKPHLIRRMLRELSSHAILIVDEFDRVKDKSTSQLFADTIKTLSDYAVPATLVIVGVAKDIDDLISEHASIDRALVQIKLPRMSMSELKDILDKGREASGIMFQDEAKERIAALSRGLPHYTHLLGLHAARQALNESRTTVCLKDVRQAIKTAVRNAQQSILSNYSQAVSATKESLYKQVLLACALAPVDALGTFNAASVRHPMTIIMGKPYTTAHFFRHLNEFCSEEHGRVLEKAGHKKRYRYMFTNPLMQPFIILHSLATGLVTESQLEQLTSM